MAANTDDMPGKPHCGGYNLRQRVVEKSSVGSTKRTPSSFINISNPLSAGFLPAHLIRNQLRMILTACDSDLKDCKTQLSDSNDLSEFKFQPDSNENDVPEDVKSSNLLSVDADDQNTAVVNFKSEMPTLSSEWASSSVPKEDVPVKKDMTVDLNVSCISVENIAVEHLEETSASEAEHSTAKFDEMDLSTSFLDDRLDDLSEILTAEEHDLPHVDSAPDLNIVPESPAVSKVEASISPSPVISDSNSVIFKIEFQCCPGRVCNNNIASITGSGNLQQIKTVMSDILKLSAPCSWDKIQNSSIVDKTSGESQVSSALPDKQKHPSVDSREQFRHHSLPVCSVSLSDNQPSGASESCDKLAMNSKRPCHRSNCEPEYSMNKFNKSHNDCHGICESSKRSNISSPISGNDGVRKKKSTSPHSSLSRGNDGLRMKTSASRQSSLSCGNGGLRKKTSASRHASPSYGNDGVRMKTSASRQSSLSRGNDGLRKKTSASRQSSLSRGNGGLRKKTSASCHSSPSYGNDGVRMNTSISHRLRPGSRNHGVRKSRSKSCNSNHMGKHYSKRKTRSRSRHSSPKNKIRVLQSNRSRSRHSSPKSRQHILRNRKSESRHSSPGARHYIPRKSLSRSSRSNSRGRHYILRKSLSRSSRSRDRHHSMRKNRSGSHRCNSRGRHCGLRKKRSGSRHSRPRDTKCVVDRSRSRSHHSSLRGKPRHRSKRTSRSRSTDSSLRGRNYSKDRAASAHKRRYLCEKFSNSNYSYSSRFAERFTRQIRSESPSNVHDAKHHGYCSSRSERKDSRARNRSRESKECYALDNGGRKKRESTYRSPSIDNKSPSVKTRTDRDTPSSQLSGRSPCRHASSPHCSSCHCRRSSNTLSSCQEKRIVRVLDVPVTHSK